MPPTNGRTNGKCSTVKVLVRPQSEREIYQKKRQSVINIQNKLRELARMGVSMSGTLNSYFDTIKQCDPELWSQYELFFKIDSNGYPIM